MKQRIKKYYRENTETVWLALCLLAGIPLAVWFSAWWFHHVDEPWAVVRRHDTLGELLYVSLFNTVWLAACHHLLLLRFRFTNRKSKAY